MVYKKLYVIMIVINVFEYLIYLGIEIKYFLKKIINIRYECNNEFLVF